MDTTDVSSVLIGQVAIATGIAGLLGLIFIVLFFIGIGFFGTLNDIFIGVTAILSVVLAWLLLPRLAWQPRSVGLGLVLVASLGALVVVIGSVLVISKTTGWFLAGLYMAAGNALIGLWLIGFSLTARGGTFLPQNLVTFGLIAGVILAFGLAAFPGILQRTDFAAYTMSVQNVIWGVGTLGWLVLYPIWCLLVGRFILAK